MSRTIDTNVLANLENDNFKYVMLVKARFKERNAPHTISYLRLNSSAQSIYWDEEGTGDIEYKGAGALGKVEAAEEGLGVQAYTIRLSLSGIDTSYISKAANVEYKNQPVIVYLANLATDNTVIGGQDGPLVLFAGRMDVMEIKLDKSATISISATSRLSDWERPRGGRYNHYTQKSYYAKLHTYPDGALHTQAKTPLDLGFTYADQIDGKEIYWGRVPFGGGGDPRYDNPPEYDER